MVWCRRVRYEETIKDIRTAVEKALGVTPQNQLLFWHKAELMPQDDPKTLLEMGLHTGFALQGYDVVRASSQEGTSRQSEHIIISGIPSTSEMVIVGKLKPLCCMDAPVQCKRIPTAQTAPSKTRVEHTMTLVPAYCAAAFLDPVSYLTL